MATDNEPRKTETNKIVLKSPNHNWQTWPFDLTEVNWCFLKGQLRLLTAAKNKPHGNRWLKQTSCVSEKRNKYSYFLPPETWFIFIYFHPFVFITWHLGQHQLVRQANHNSLCQVTVNSSLSEPVAVSSGQYSKEKYLHVTIYNQLHLLL